MQQLFRYYFTCFYIIIIPIAILGYKMKSAHKFKSLRLQMNLSQIDLANLLSIKQSTLSNYETGKRNPSLGVCYKLIRLAKLKDIKIDIEHLRPEE